MKDISLEPWLDLKWSAFHLTFAGNTCDGGTKDERAIAKNTPPQVRNTTSHCMD
jgi:hypothetical protein